MMRKLYVSAFLGLLAFAAPSLPFAQDRSILPADRQTVWSPGVPGGIPARTTVCATVNAATYGDGASDATNGIKSAISSCPVGQVVQLSAGTFKISSGPIILNKGVVLRGAGPANTLLQVPNGRNTPVIVVGPDWWISMTGSTNLTANAVKGATSVAVASTSGLSVGQLVLIDQLTDTSITQWAPNCDSSCKGWFSRTDRPVSQMMEISSISGNTVTFTTPFHIGFDTAHAAQLTRFGSTAVRNAGIEDLKVYGGEGGDSGGNIYFELAMYSWVKNVESEYSSGASLHLYHSFRNTIRDSYFHKTKSPEPGGSGYGVDISRASADNLFENNVVWRFNILMLMRASGGGNVVGYSYFEDGYIGSIPGWVVPGITASHFTTPHYELFEGNQGFNLGGENVWGNSAYITFFRNHSTTIRRSVGGLGLTDQGARAAVNIAAGHRYYSFIGNVLGYDGMTPQPQGTSFTYEDTSPYADNPVPMWRFGKSDNAQVASDPQVAATALRDGNYDYVTRTVKWDRTAVTLPNSLYLAGKPAFMGSCTWPWVDPIGSTKLYTLPARARFDGSPNACAGAVTLLPPVDVRVQ